MEKYLFKNKIVISILFFMISVCVFSGCGQSTDTGEQAVSVEKNVGTDESDLQPDKSEETERIMKILVNDEELSVTWEDNESVNALMQMVSKEPLTIDMSIYGDFEQVGSIGQDLPRNDEQMTTSAGDIVLYSGNQIVVFYGSNSWSYTKLGHIEDRTQDELTQMLGQDHVSLTVSSVEEYKK